MASLFEAIGKNHGVTREQVRQSLAHRPVIPDLAVNLSFALVYGLAASWMARRLWRRYPPDEGWVPGVALAVITAAFASAAGVLLGEVWSQTAESIRIGSGHLSYRVNRIPWSQHRLGLFAGGVVLFWLIAALHRPLNARARAAA